MNKNQILLKRIILTNLLGSICFFGLQVVSALYIHISPAILEPVAFITFIFVNFALLKQTTLSIVKKVIAALTLTVLVMLGGYAIFNLSTSSISEDDARMNIPEGYIVPTI